jgi:hypothetical protein
MQLELFPWEALTDQEQADILQSIRRTYWHIRTVRKTRFGQAKLRRHYREVAAQKKRLLEAGVEKREILDFLSCCRLQCSARKQPFKPCRYCR